MVDNRQPIISVENVTKVFSSGVFFRTLTTAVRGVSFAMYPGTVLSLIGESGSGKTTMGRMILKLLRPTAGRILFHGRDLATIRTKAERREFYRRVQGIFQDPFSSFNPLFRVDRVFDLVFDVFFPDTPAAERAARTREALLQVNLNPERTLAHFPHQLSGGQLQRLLIARALLLNAEILVADELISMLDASTRMGILNLLVDICRSTGMSVLFITHDLALGYYVSDYTMIMHQGRLVEQGATAEVYHHPVHPYTKMLFRSVPDIGRRWDPQEKFVPEAVNREIAEFYAANRGQGMVQVSPDHAVLMSLE
ncbi:MAG: ABC transporter ATP-binding protein [Firmicutes bacterium]|nr:ABC transporter ATP-binding protein [Bacillota bacterium]